MQLVGLDYRFSKVNSTFCRLVGYTEEELRTLTPFDITHPEDTRTDKELASGLLRGSVPKFETSGYQSSLAPLPSAHTSGSMGDKGGKKGKDKDLNRRA